MRARLSKSVLKPIVAVTTMVAAFVGIGSRTFFVPMANAQSAPEKAFVATGDAICKKSNVRLAKQALEFERHKLITRKTARSVTLRVAKPSDVAEFVKKVAIKELQGQLDELGALTPPKSQEVAFADALREAASGLASMKAKPEDAAFENPFVKSGKMLSAMGFRSCGQNEAGSSSV
jgi:hypothetical protein